MIIAIVTEAVLRMSADELQALIDELAESVNPEVVRIRSAMQEAHEALFKAAK